MEKLFIIDEELYRYVCKNHYSSLYLGFNNKEFTNELTVTSWTNNEQIQ